MSSKANRWSVIPLDFLDLNRAVSGWMLASTTLSLIAWGVCWLKKYHPNQRSWFTRSTWCLFQFSLKLYHPKLGVSLGIYFDYRTHSWSVATTPHLHEPPFFGGTPIDANWLGSHHFIKHGWLGNPRTKWAFEWEMHRTKWILSFSSHAWLPGKYIVLLRSPQVASCWWWVVAMISHKKGWDMTWYNLDQL